MEELCELIYTIKEDKEKFALLLEKFKPLIRKYANHLYLDDREDVEAELTLALWEAVIKIEFCHNDGQVVKYLSTSIRNKYLELYRASQKFHNNTTHMDEYEMNNITAPDKSIQDWLILEDMVRFENKLKGKKKLIFESVFIHNLTDAEIAHQMDISRQYVHRVRKELCDELKSFFTINSLQN